MAETMMNDSGPRPNRGAWVILRMARFASGLGLLGAVFYSLLFSFTYSNRLRIHFHRDQYQHQVFEVRDAVYHPRNGEVSESYWFNGQVAGRQERFIPDFAEGFDVESREDLLFLYPVGTRIDVLYNPNETETIIQNETLRVLHDFPGFWEKEDLLRGRLFRVVVIPVPVALCFYLVFRLLHQRARSRHLTNPGRVTVLP